jgi:hypothetical protein
LRVSRVGTKCADANEEPANRQTIGLLQRRHITIDHIIYIGRESNQLEDVDAGLVRKGDDRFLARSVIRCADILSTLLMLIPHRGPPPGGGGGAAAAFAAAAIASQSTVDG